MEIDQWRERRPLSKVAVGVAVAKKQSPPRDFIGAICAAGGRTGKPGLIAEVGSGATNAQSMHRGSRCQQTNRVCIAFLLSTGKRLPGLMLFQLAPTAQMYTFAYASA